MTKMDREKVKYDIERCICHVPDACRDCSHYKHGEYLDCMEELLKDALAMLKEQADEISRITNEYLNLVKVASKKPDIVRCKDCKHRPKEPNLKTYKSGFDIEFPEGSKCPCQCSDEYYSWYPDDNWFCADGERKDS